MVGFVDAAAHYVGSKVRPLLHITVGRVSLSVLYRSHQANAIELHLSMQAQHQCRCKTKGEIMGARWPQGT